jgi:hypothetical protein
MLLNGLVGMQKQKSGGSGNKLIDELIHYARAKNDSKKLSVDTKVSLQNLEFFLKSKVLGLDAIFE